VLVIFDCDGVLVDSELLSNRALAQALTAAGHPHTTEQCLERYMGRSWASCMAVLGGEPPGLFEDYRRRMFAAFERELRAVTGVEGAVRAVLGSGHEVCVASSGEHDKIRFTLGLTGLLEHFGERIFSATDVARGKPAPDLFLHAAATLGFAPADCVVVEDSPLGIEGARAAGMRAFGYAALTPPISLGEADEVFSDMSELPSLLGIQPAWDIG
jgi:HAD superfamily hydrolase (TIGR01509 family)